VLAMNIARFLSVQDELGIGCERGLDLDRSDALFDPLDETEQ
jgi:hypothetical protein